MIPVLGHQILILALGLSIFTIIVTFAAQWKSIRAGDVAAISPTALRWLDVTRNSALALCALITTASLMLEYLLLTNDFSVQTVWDHSSRAQKLFYKIVAFWGGMSGSMLLWAQILAIYIVIMILWGNRLKHRKGYEHWARIIPTSVAVLCIVEAFFLIAIIFMTNPFTVMAPPHPTDGIGLNPLLLNYWMQIHPPTLYLGYVGCAIPFSLAVGALLYRRFDRQWVHLSANWALFVWMVLFAGMIMGGVWAYETLGWGGYWAWDPVENASLIPWIALTALVHSMHLQKRRGALKSFNMLLTSLVFLLSIFGTYLTRSGIVVSVHSFAKSDIGEYFLAFLGVMLVALFALIVWRRDELAARVKPDGGWSRENLLVIGSWLMVASTFAVLFGTVYPVIHESLMGQEITVSQPYYRTVMAPLGLLILFLAGITPLLDWRKMDKKKAFAAMKWPLLLAAATLPFFFLVGRHHVGATISFALSFAMVAAVVQLFAKGTIARARTLGEDYWTAFFNLLSNNRRSYGAYIVHLGLAAFFVGATGSNVFQIERDPVLLRPGQIMQVGEYTMKYTGLEVPDPIPADKDGEIGARVLIAANGKQLTKRNGEPVSLFPYIDFYKPNAEAAQTMPGQGEQTAGRPAILKTLSNDLYLALTSYDQGNNTASIKVYLNPLVSWVWISVGIFLAGTVIAMWPQSRRTRRPSSRNQKDHRQEASAHSSAAVEDLIDDDTTHLTRTS